MLRLVLVAAFCVAHVLGSSPCPPRESIYPCRCTEVDGDTIIVTCFKLEASNNLSAIFNNLREMYIDHFSIYDSFWETNEQNKLPADWINQLHIGEIEIVDSGLSRCFACDATLGSNNDFLRRFAVINSSSSESICTVCNSNERANFSWTASFKQLEHFEFSGSKLSALRVDFFPRPMDELQVLNLTKNQISAIETKALMYLPKLKKLDLSHNVISMLYDVFGEKNENLQFIDLSYNLLKSIGSYILNSVPRLRHLELRHNRIEVLLEWKWKETLKISEIIDFRGNRILCDCRLNWTKSLINSNVLLGGICDDNFLPLSRLYKFIPQNCDKNRNEGTRPSSLRRRTGWKGTGIGAFEPRLG